MCKLQRNCNEVLFTILIRFLSLFVSTVIPNSVGGTAASASITVNNPNATGAGSKLNGGIMAIALTSVATAAYVLI
jgi:hypothetical protein